MEIITIYIAIMQNQDVFKTYQHKPFEGSSHTWAIKQMDSFDRNSKILDFGAGAGIVGQGLLQKGFENLYAVDINQEACDKLSTTYRKTALSLEQLGEEQFDVVILLDILEHMTDPFRFLKIISDKVSNQGYILISLPNIAHWSIRLNLLFGFFEYTERGILDKTHYNHFNKRRAKNLVKSAGLDLLEYKVSISPVQFVLPQIIWNNKLFKFCDRLRLMMANVAPGLLGYQHLMTIQKK